MHDADPANETLRMPKAVQSRDVVFQNGSSAAAAFRCKHVKVILPAKSFSIFFMKTCTEKTHVSEFIVLYYTTFCIGILLSKSHTKHFIIKIACYPLGQKRSHTEHRRSVQGAMSCPEPLQLSEKTFQHLL